MKAKAKQTPFSRLSAAQKRVAIAKDVVAQIKAHQFIIEQGTWLDVQFDPEEKVACQAVLTGKAIVLPKCTCCALGAAMASSLRLFNIGEYDSEPSFEDIQEQLGRFFSQEQMALIEAAFECRANEGALSEFEAGLEAKDMEQIRKFERIQSDTKRALSIFSNIVKNNGTFVP